MSLGRKAQADAFDRGPPALRAGPGAGGDSTPERALHAQRLEGAQGKRRGRGKQLTVNLGRESDVGVK